MRKKPASNTDVVVMTLSENDSVIAGRTFCAKLRVGMKFNAKTILAVIFCTYAGVSLALYLLIHITSIFFPGSAASPMALVYISVVSILLPAWVTSGLYEKSFEWKGFFNLNNRKLKFCRTLLLLSVLNIASRFILSYITVNHTAWNKDSIHGKNAIWLFYTSMLISASLLVFLYSLFGVPGIASATIVKIYRDPISLIKSKK